MSQINLFDMGVQGSMAIPDNPLEMLPSIKRSLPGSHGERFLKTKGIPLELAQAHGLGYAEYGKWPHLQDGIAVNQSKLGRLVIPCTNPFGVVINLYGKAIGKDDIPDDHLSVGPKGLFNGKAVLAETVFLCPDPFDALTLISLGYETACGIFDAKLSLNWIKSRKIVFCLNPINVTNEMQDLAKAWTQQGRDVCFIPQDVCSGQNSLNEARVAGTLKMDNWRPFLPSPLTYTFVQNPTEGKEGAQGKQDQHSTPPATTNESWNDELVDRIAIAADTEIRGLYVKGSIQWAEEKMPDFIKAWDQSEKGIEKAYKAKDMTAYKKAFGEYVKVLQDMCNAFKRNQLAAGELKTA